MDPDANLQEQMRLAYKLYDSDNPSPEDVARLCDLIFALNNWILNGGFLPEVWARKGGGK